LPQKFLEAMPPAAPSDRHARRASPPRLLPRGALKDALHRLRRKASRGTDRPKRRAVSAHGLHAIDHSHLGRIGNEPGPDFALWKPAYAFAVTTP
jgi:hypothetical protein